MYGRVRKVGVGQFALNEYEIRPIANDELVVGHLQGGRRAARRLREAVLRRSLSVLIAVRDHPQQGYPYRTGLFCCRYRDFAELQEVAGHCGLEYPWGAHPKLASEGYAYTGRILNQRIIDVSRIRDDVTIDSVGLPAGSIGKLPVLFSDIHVKDT